MFIKIRHYKQEDILELYEIVKVYVLSMSVSCYLVQMIHKFPSVKIDVGAVSFVCNEAQIMRPGITKCDTFFKGDIVVVKDEIHEKTLAVGIALEDSQIARNSLKGYVIDNLHYISDKFWKSHKEINY